MTRIRKRIAERLMQSKNAIAMLTSFNEVNLAAVMAMRKAQGEAFAAAHGIKLGFMSFFVKAAANALQRYPVVNASVDGDDVIYHGYADIRSEEHTSELQSLMRISYAVFCLKKKKK